MPTRRAVLTSLGAATGTAIAGCTGTRTETSVRGVCSASIAGGAGENVIFSLTPQVQSYGADGPPVVELLLPVRRSVARDRNLDLLTVETGGSGGYRIPVDPANDEPVGAVQRYETDDVVEYTQALGHLPQAGRYRLRALNRSGTELDSLTLDFRCYRQARNPTG